MKWNKVFEELPPEGDNHLIMVYFDGFGCEKIFTGFRKGNNWFTEDCLQINNEYLRVISWTYLPKIYEMEK